MAPKASLLITLKDSVTKGLRSIRKSFGTLEKGVESSTSGMKKDVSSFEDSVKTTADTIKKFGALRAPVPLSTSKAVESLRNLRAETKRLKEETERSTSGMKKDFKGLEGAMRLSASRIGKAFTSLGRKIKAFPSGVRKSFALLDKGIRGFSKGIGRALDITRKNLIRFAKGATVLSAIIGGLGFAVLRTSGKFEQWNIAFKVMLGSADKAKKLFSEIKDFAVKTPFEVVGLVEAAKQMLAFGFAQKEIIPLLRQIGDITAALGTEKFPSIVSALGKIRTKGFANLRELNILLRAGVPILEELANVTGRETEEILQLVSTGKIGFPIVQEAINNMTKEGSRFGGLMVEQSTTLFGIISNLKDVFGLLSAALGDKLLPVAKEVANEFLNFATNLLASGKVEKFGEKLAARLKSMVKSIKDFIAEARKTGSIERFFLNLGTTIKKAAISFQIIVFGLKVAKNETVAFANKSELLAAKLKRLQKIASLGFIDPNLTKRQRLQEIARIRQEIADLSAFILRGSVEFNAKRAKIRLDESLTFEELTKKARALVEETIAKELALEKKLNARKLAGKIATNAALVDGAKSHFDIINEEQAKFDEKRRKAAELARSLEKLDEEAALQKKAETEKAFGEAKADANNQLAEDLGAALFATEGKIGEAAGQAVVKRLNSEIDAIVATQVGEALIKAVTNPAFFALVPLIFAAGGAAKAGLSSIKFHEGGPVQSFQQGGPVDRGRLGPNEVPATLERGERVLTESTDADLRRMINKLSSKIDAMGQQPVIIQIDGREIARATAPFNPQFSKLNKVGS